MKSLEENYEKLATDFSHRLPQKVILKISPNIQSFHEAIGWPDARDWVIGSLKGYESLVVSPHHPGPEHSYDSVLKSPIHNLVKMFICDTFGQNVPAWLIRGVCLYKANQGELYSDYFEKLNINTSSFYSIEMLEKVQDLNTADRQIFPDSFLYVKLMCEQWGWDRVLALLADYSSLEQSQKVELQNLLVESFDKGL